MDTLRIAEIVSTNFQVLELQSALKDKLPLSQLQDLGIDPVDLIGLSQQEIAQRLMDAGLAEQALVDTDLTEIVAELPQAQTRA